jgi:hypothetical protein
MMNVVFGLVDDLELVGESLDGSGGEQRDGKQATKHDKPLLRGIQNKWRRWAAPMSAYPSRVAVAIRCGRNAGRLCKNAGRFHFNDDAAPACVLLASRDLPIFGFQTAPCAFSFVMPALVAGLSLREAVRPLSRSPDQVRR